MNTNLLKLAIEAKLVRSFTIESGAQVAYVDGDMTELKAFAHAVVEACLDIAEPMPGSGDIDDLRLEQVQAEIRRHFGMETKP